MIILYYICRSDCRRDGLLVYLSGAERSREAGEDGEMAAPVCSWRNITAARENVND